MIKVTNVSKSFERAKALDALSFTVEKGEACALVGLKGAGKTTALDIIAGCLDADAGSVEICGVDIAAETSSARQHIGYVPAEPALYQDMSPRAALKFVADARGLLPRESAEKIDAALKLVGIIDVADKPIARLSAGARRMTALAQAIFFEPDVVVIDEAAAQLDPKEIVAFRKVVAELKKNAAVLLASNNLTEMCAVCDRVMVLSEGRIVSCGTPDQLHNMTRVADSVAITVVGSPEVAKGVFSLQDIAEVTDCVSEGDVTKVVVKMTGDSRVPLFGAAATAKLPIIEMVPARKSLEDLLESLVSERLEGEGDEA